LAAARIECGWTQAALAEQAGISKRTLERLESGEVAVQLSGLLRVCRALGLLERFEGLLPDSAPGPIARLRDQGRRRQRVARKRAATGAPKPWTWEDAT
jgi:transcriptional regulator with XRE-family HTH domain